LRRLKNDKGSVAVEFALLAPLMVIVLFAIIEFGIAMTRAVAYSAGAREGARYAAVRCSPPASVCTSDLIQSRIVASIPAGYPVSFTNFTTSTTCSNATVGSLVTVTWEQGVPIHVPFLPDLSWTLHPSGTFRCE